MKKLNAISKDVIASSVSSFAEVANDLTDQLRSSEFTELIQIPKVKKRFWVGPFRVSIQIHKRQN